MMESQDSMAGSPGKMGHSLADTSKASHADAMDGKDGFRASEIAFLQEQNNSVLSALENLESERDNTLRLVREWEDKEQQMLVETANVNDKIKVLQEALVGEKAELISKDEHVRVLSQQNQQMLELLENEEGKTKDTLSRIAEFKAENDNLSVLETEFEKIKKEIDALIKSKKEEAISLAEQLREFRNLNESLRADIASVDAQTQVDIEALNQVLSVVSNKNVEYLQQLQKQDTREQQLNEELSGLKDASETLKRDIERMKKQMDGDEDERSRFERDRASLQQKIESLESQIDILKRTLNTAEKANEQLHEENRRSAEKFREMADKVYGLMDSLRLNQVELKRLEAENAAKNKKFANTEKLIANGQSKISMELDARNIAEQEKEDADQEALLLKKKNKKVEESIATAQTVQEQIGKHLVELNEQINALQTQNAYLASRIDGQEEEKNSLKGEIKKSSDRFQDMHPDTALREEIEKLDATLIELRETVTNLRAELDYVKREDVLDDQGRQRPILIQSNESTLLEKLQINEFLYEAQQNKNPVPSLVEKLAQLLELLHTSQAHCDQYLGDLSKSNSLVSALRQKNLVLFEKTSMFESYKTRALVRYMMNLFESGQSHTLPLDGLFFTQREITELCNLTSRYQVQEKIFFISLAENGLTDDSINIILQLVMTTPYLKALDLRRNAFTGSGIQKFADQTRVMEGVTSVIKTATGQINVHSGMNVKEADDFLTNPAGLTALNGQNMLPSAIVENGGKLDDLGGGDKKAGAAVAAGGKLPAVGAKAKGGAKKGAARANVPPPLFVLNKNKQKKAGKPGSLDELPRATSSYAESESSFSGFSGMSDISQSPAPISMRSDSGGGGAGRMPSERVLDKWQVGNYNPNPIALNVKRNNFVRPESGNSADSRKS